VQHVSAFASLSPDALSSLAASLQEERFAAGTVIVTEGEVGDRLYLIAEGQAEVTAKGPSGPVILASRHPGDPIGELSLLGPLLPRHATVTASTELVTLTLDATSFDELLERYPAVRQMLEVSAEERLVQTFLKRATPFTRLDAERAQALARRLEPVSVPAGAAIIRQGEPGDACYLLRSGRVEVVAEENGVERRIATHWPGALFGETALLIDAPRNATVRALEACELLVLRRSDLLEAMGEEQQVALRVLELVQLRERPEQVPGILTSQRTTPEGEVVTVLKDPARFVYYRLSPEGYFLWGRLDGRHTLRDLALDYLEEYKSFSPQAIVTVVAGLAAAGFLRTRRLREDVKADAIRLSRWQRAALLAQRILEWRAAFSGVDGILDQLYRGGVRLLYTIPGQVALGLVVLAGLAAFFLRSGRAGAALGSDPKLLLFFIPLYLLSIVLHEAGHAFTVKAFGRQVPRAGVGWYWFSPIAYVDTSDMWLAGRWPRIAVSLAGPYASMMAGALASLAMLAVSHAGAVAVLWELAFVSYLSVLLNLNPLLEYDGYFILMDWLDRPNLRAHCLPWVGHELPRALRSRRELWRHRLELLYGVGSVLYVLVMGIVTLVVYQLVVQRWIGHMLPSGVAAALAWVLAATVVTLSLAALTGELRGKLRVSAGTGTPGDSSSKQ